MSFGPEMEAKAVQALRAMQGDKALAEAVWAEVNAFFARHTELERTEYGAAFIASLYTEHLSAPADSRPAQPKKVV